ncbi:MAG: glycosyltransferase, partial [Flavobacterium sp.]|nr:glycosyltransferase [Flavobacterium sp.]
LNILDVVSLLGIKTQDYIKEIFKTIYIFLMYSIKDSTGREETQGVVSAEAQAMGLPVVAFNSGGVPYTIKENETGFLIEQKNIEKYAEAIAFLIDNPEVYEKMSLQAPKFIENNLSNIFVFDKLLTIYQNI